MEIRNYEELQSIIEEFYKNYSDSQLKYFEKHLNIQRPQLVIPYCVNDSLFSHTLKITIPGKKTFETPQKKTSSIKQSNDIKITLIEDHGEKAITHEEIIKDLYQKIAIHDDINLRCMWYKNLRTLLTYLYDSNRLTDNDWNEWILSANTNGEELPGKKIPALVSFIRWCAAQEMINYPRGWGKDLCFARYFEAIYAGFIQDQDLLEKTVVRANSNGRPQSLDSITDFQDSTANLSEHGIEMDIYNNRLLSRR